MKQRINKFAVILLSFLMAWSLASTSIADKDSTRIRIGLKLFRTILAADTKINDKKDSANELPLVLVYRKSQTDAEFYADKLRVMGKGSNQGKIKKIPLSITIISADQLQQLEHIKPAGIFLLEELEKEQLQQFVNYGIKSRIITYSPFAGAVEQGITAGISIDARVKPYLNNNTLEISHLQLKSFFLKVSKRYEH